MEEKGIVFNVQKFCINDGPGIRTMVFLKGCPLRCVWCSNPESQCMHPETDVEGTVYGRIVTVKDLLPTLMQDQPFFDESSGGITLSGGEPLMQIDFTLALLKAIHAQGIHIAIETTGAVPHSDFKRAAEYVDLFLFDVKHHDSAKHKLYTGLDNEGILKNLRYTVSHGKDVWVRIPVIPGVNDSIEDAHAFCRLLKPMGVRRVDILPFHQFGEKKYELLNRKYAFKGISAYNESMLSSYLQVFRSYGL